MASKKCYLNNKVGICRSHCVLVTKKLVQVAPSLLIVTHLPLNMHLFINYSIYGYFFCLGLPDGTLMPEKTSSVVDHPCFVLLPSAHGATLPSREPLKGLQTCSVENMGATQQHLQQEKKYIQV